MSFSFITLLSFSRSLDFSMYVKLEVMLNLQRKSRDSKRKLVVSLNLKVMCLNLKVIFMFNSNLMITHNSILSPIALLVFWVSNA